MQFNYLGAVVEPRGGLRHVLHENRSEGKVGNDSYAQFLALTLLG